jgi:DNA invertase Pin-like site-specific DNA recombinase
MDCRGKAEQLGWSVGEVYVDDDVSAYRGRRRPEFSRMSADIAAGARDGLIFWHPDRLLRSPRELEDFIDLVSASAIPIVTVQAGDYDLTTATGRLNARIVGVVARHESEHMAERIRRSQEDMAARGEFKGGGRRPFGYECSGHGRKSCPLPSCGHEGGIYQPEAELLRDAATRLLAGESLRSIVRLWQADGVGTVSGAPWSAATVKRILIGARIAGLRRHRGEVIGPAQWPAIISQELSEQLRARLGSEAYEQRPRRYLLTGIVYCGGCGARMTGRPTKTRVRRYVCVADHGGCNKVGIAAEPVEEIVADAALVALDNPASMDRLRSASLDSSLSSLLADLQAGELRLQQLTTDHYAHGLIGRAEFFAARAELEGRNDHLRSQISSATAKLVTTNVATAGGSLRNQWLTMPLDRQAAVIRAVLERVTIAPVLTRSGRFDQERLGLVWRF